MAPCTGLFSSLSKRAPVLLLTHWLVWQVLADLRQAVAAICSQANNESTECQGYSMYYIYRQNGVDEAADPPGCSGDCAAASRPFSSSCE